MSLIKLPPGMTADQYLATPEGQRVSQELAKFQAWMDAQQRRSGSQYGQPMGDALQPPAYDPPSRPRQPAQRQPVTRRDKAPLSPGRAQPKSSSDMNATRLMDATVSDLSAALAEMFPEMGVGERSMLARELAEEYMRERREAASAIKPKTPVAPMTEQMEFDTAFSKMSQERAREERMRKRMEEALKKYNWDEPEKPAKQAPRRQAAPGTAAMKGCGHPDFTDNGLPSAQMITYWHNPQTGESVAMPDGSCRPNAGTPWKAGRAPTPGQAQSVAPPTSAASATSGPVGPARPAAGAPSSLAPYSIRDGGGQYLSDSKKASPMNNPLVARDVQKRLYEKAAKHGEAPHHLRAEFLSPAARAAVKREQDMYRPPAP